LRRARDCSSLKVSWTSATSSTRTGAPPLPPADVEVLLGVPGFRVPGSGQLEAPAEGEVPPQLGTGGLRSSKRVQNSTRVRGPNQARGPHERERLAGEKHRSCGRSLKNFPKLCIRLNLRKGPGTLPGYEYHSGDHTTTLVPVYAKGKGAFSLNGEKFRVMV
jgi:hypothetical protein